ncbi:MAG: C10 family peptidase [Bacteroidales bacterium]
MKKAMTLLICAFLIMVSCDKSIINTEENAEHPSYQQEDKISNEAVTLTAEEAVIVAKLFNVQMPTKADSDLKVANVKTIMNDRREPLIYAVNYAESKGFTMVSATKKYYPVVAQVGKGNYNGRATDCGMDVVLDAIQQDIEKHMLLSDDQTAEIRELWKQYEKTPIFEYVPTKTDPAMDLRNSSIAAWEAQGYECISLQEAESELPANIYQTFCNNAQAQANTNYDYLQYSVVLISTAYPESITGPLMSTNWNQTESYASAMPTGLSQTGCYAVAMGQIMNYYEFPTTYNWNSMPDGYASITTALFLRGIWDNIKISDNSSASTDSIAELSFQRDYNYNATLYGYSRIVTRVAIENSNPVFMSGSTVSPMSLGHVWVCDGKKDVSRVDTYSLKVLSVYAPLVYENCATPYETTLSSYQYLHMNWGFGGSYNGWFIGDNVTIQGTNFGELRNIMVPIPNN